MSCPLSLSLSLSLDASSGVSDSSASYEHLESVRERTPSSASVSAESSIVESSKARERAFCFTLNNYDGADAERLRGLVASGKVRYIVFGFEVAPTTGTPHLQGFVYCKDAKSHAAVAKILPRCFVCRSKDNPRTGYIAAIEYCKKCGSWEQYGVPPVSQVLKGAASAEMWDRMLTQAKAGDFDSIPSVFVVRYYSTFKNIRKDFMKAPENSPTCTGVWIQGPAGCGKSKFCRDILGDNSKFYRKMRNQWWDGYQNQDYVVCDDMDKYNVSLGGLIKDWTDRYAFTAEAKGGALSIRPKLVFFTSQYAISDIWTDRETTDAITRRCFIVNMFDSTVVLPSLIEITEGLVSRNLNH